MESFRSRIWQAREVDQLEELGSSVDVVDMFD